jgi:elongation factor P
MNSTNYEQFGLPATMIGEGAKYMTDNLEIQLLQYDGKPIGVELPTTVTLLITKTDPGFKGDTANPGTKPAQVETGATIDVPLFVSEGDKVKIDTRTGRYVERVS